MCVIGVFPHEIPTTLLHPPLSLTCSNLSVYGAIFPFTAESNVKGYVLYFVRILAYDSTFFSSCSAGSRSSLTRKKGLCVVTLSMVPIPTVAHHPHVVGVNIIIFISSFDIAACCRFISISLMQNTITWYLYTLPNWNLKPGYIKDVYTERLGLYLI
jgi:hypothetical protein